MYVYIVEYKKDPDFITLKQVKQCRNNKKAWVKIVSIFMSGIVHRYAGIEAEKKDIESYCPAGGEAVVFLALENNFERWVAEIKRKDEETKNDDGAAMLPPLPEPLFSKKSAVGNGKSYGGWSALGIERFNSIMREIKSYNENTVQLADYNKALKKACRERKEENESPRKRRRSTEERPKTKVKYCLPSGMVNV